jgi:CRP-like cAMP-binding protein
LWLNFFGASPLNSDNLGSLESASIDELIEEHVRSLKKLIARQHTFNELEIAIANLYELVQSLKFRNELLSKMIDDVPTARRKLILETIAAHREVVRKNGKRLSELTSKSHRLIAKSEKLFTKLGIENVRPSSSLPGQRNLLLAALPSVEYSSLIPKLERISILPDKILYHPEAPIEYVYFPETAVLTIVAAMSNGASVEVGLVGAEGMLGVRALFGSVAAPTLAVALVGGTALRMRVHAFRDAIQESELLQELLLKYSHLLLTQVRQSAACTNFHSIERRLARWLLMLRDITSREELILTQSRIAQMMGTRLAGVSEAASRLQRAGLIRYHRGHITIVDRQSLRQASCECYEVIRKQFEQLLRDYVSISREQIER